MSRILAPIALAAAFAAAALTTTARPALALDDPVLSASDGSSSVCGEGKTVECGSTTTYKCTSWLMQPTIGPNGISYTYFCTSSITQVSKSYKD